MLEDEARDVTLANRALKEGDIPFSLKRVVTRSAFLNELQKNTPDLIISDHALPDFDGSAALQLAREKSPDIPFIFFTSSLGEENILDNLKMGASDYVLKHRINDLAPAVRRVLREKEERIRRKQAEAALRKSEEQLRALIENVTDYAIYMLDIEGRVASWNAGAERMKGYQAEEVIGKPFSVFFSGEDAESRIPESLLRRSPIEGTTKHQGWCVRKDGTRFCASWSITPVRDGSGKINGFSTVTRDVTEQAKAEEALQKSEERYRLLVEFSPCGVLVHSGGRVIFSNSTAAKMLGAKDLQQMLGRSIRDFIHPDCWAAVEKRIESLHAGKIVPFLEEIWVGFDGRPVDVMVGATPLVFEKDFENPVIQVIALDISELKRSEEDLRKSEERFRLAVESVKDYAIYMLDKDGRVTSWNEGAERITGLGADEVLSKVVNHCEPDNKKAKKEAAKELERAAMEGRIQNEGWCQRKDGSSYYAIWTVTAVKDAADTITGFLKVARDVTERKQHEEQVARWNTELEQRVAERTAQLEAANKELEAFSYSVSHDLRAPLRHIDGFVDILQTTALEKLDEESRQHLQTIADSAKQMAKLIDDLLGFSRMSRVKMNKRQVNLATLVQDAARHLQGDMKGRAIEWAIGDLPTVEGDPEMLRQVFMNLIDNALKYSRNQKKARVEIGSFPEEDDNVVFVRDNGVGFDMRYADKLFGVFQRLHRAAEFEGTGVGLANVRRIIHRHGGRTWAEGEINAGATFYFTLPKKVIE
ncbi:multi-sensor signal transduction histidine kinase [Pedosphaera parvula Ellin514]|uniref:histidine kinase n=2 Tax=Pedosphaera TaxID=1032526 RepID=B9XGC6_PEDPL|nr:multi-sensor signal transduction histidine kinase [Pedosphaera parvula Ellin514]